MCVNDEEDGLKEKIQLGKDKTKAIGVATG